jgi:hypothetical protein
MAQKVKESTIKEIKKMGMTKALASAKTRRNNAEFQEALRRMYGERRLTAALKGSQGGSQSRATYMYKGTPGMKKKTTTGRNTPGAPTGTGARQVANRQKTNSKGSRAGAIAGGAAAAAAGVATGRSLSKKAKATQAMIGSMTKSQISKAKAAAAKNVMPKQGIDIARGMQKFAVTKAGKAVGKTARALTGKAARRTAVGAIALTAYDLAKQARNEANKAGRKVNSAGSGRAAQMKNIKRKTKGR